MAEEYLSLSNLKSGAAVEMFDDELKRVLTNIQDVNTDPKTVRELTLTVKIKPSEDREFGAVSMEVKSKLAHPKPETTFINMGKRGGRAVAVEQGQRSISFDAESEAANN